MVSNFTHKALAIGQKIRCTGSLAVTKSHRISRRGSIMKLKNGLAAIAAMSLVSAPVVAQAATADQSRISSDVDGENLSGGFIIPLIAVIAVILGILAITDDGGDRPTSP